MKKIFLLSLTFLSGCAGNFLLLADTPSSSSNSSTLTQTPADSAQKSKSSDAQEEQSQMAGWMIESAQTAKDYLNDIDREMYMESWAKGDQLFQHTITKEEWARALTDSRKPLGKVNSRKLKDQRPAKDPNGLPRGAYMVIEYNTSFDKAPESNELLTLRRGTDGKWRVLTYQAN